MFLGKHHYVLLACVVRQFFKLSHIEHALVSLVERMLELHKRSPRTPQEQEMVKRALGRAPRMIRSSPAADVRIDRLVYELSPEGDDI